MCLFPSEFSYIRPGTNIEYSFQIRHNEKCDAHRQNFWCNLSCFHKTGTSSYIMKLKSRFALKRTFYWTSKSAISVEKGVFFLPRIREKGVIFKLGYERGIRFVLAGSRGAGVETNLSVLSLLNKGHDDESFVSALVLIHCVDLHCGMTLTADKVTEQPDLYTIGADDTNVDGSDASLQGGNIIFVSKQWKNRYLVYWHSLSNIRAWISNHTKSLLWNVRTHPCFNFRCRSADELYIS